MTVVKDIRNALQNELLTLSGISTSQIAWENVKFDPAAGNVWYRLRMTIESQKPPSVGLSTPIMHEGLFLIDVFRPQNEGTAAADDEADDIVNVFTRDLLLPAGSKTVRIRHSERRAGINDAPWYFVPVQILWYCYV